MRVVCDTVEQFVRNLRLERDVYQRVVRVQVTSNPAGVGTSRDAPVLSVNFQASAVVRSDDGGEFLLEVGEDCGHDWRDKSQRFEGTARAKELEDMVRRACEELGLEVRPGLIVL